MQTAAKRHWTTREEIILRNLWDEGRSVGFIATRLNRSKEAVLSRRKRLKLNARRRWDNHDHHSAFLTIKLPPKVRDEFRALAEHSDTTMKAILIAHIEYLTRLHRRPAQR